MGIKKVRLYYNTLKYLKPIQIFGRLYSIFKQNLYTKSIVKISIPDIEVKLLSPKTSFIFHDPWNNRKDLENNTFIFLNIKHNFKNRIQWNLKNESLLWKFNLHYFNYLHLLNKYEQETICKNWIIKNKYDNKVAWHPYVISLRIINWCKIGFNDLEINNSIYLQAEYLFRNLEFYHPANHYLENARALIFAGLYFNSERSEKWLRKGIKIFNIEANKQVLNDGVYFEKSIMYHAIILEGILDIINILPQKHKEIPFFTLIANKMIEFLKYSTHPNGKIALINDSTEEIAPLTKDLIDYANRIGITASERLENNVKWFPESKFLSFRDEKIFFILKGGNIGPDFIPAHAHADVFTFELSYLNQKIIVDSGVYNYQCNDEREYCRSTAAHNCVEIDGINQAQVWSTFRVGKRFSPIKENIQLNNGFEYSGKFTGYRKLIGDNLIHTRTVEYKQKTKVFSVQDLVEGEGRHLIISHIHFHPSLEVKKCQNPNMIEIKNKKCKLLLTIPNGEIVVDNGFYCPRFGVKDKNYHIKIIAKTLPTNLSYTLEIFEK